MSSNALIQVEPSTLGPDVGRGVFAAWDIPRGASFEVAHILLIPKDDRKFIDGTAIYGYYFGWEDGQVAIALSTGSLINHSRTPNAEYVKSYRERTISFVALNNIERGTEIFIDYNSDPEFEEALWFEPIEVSHD